MCARPEGFRSASNRLIRIPSLPLDSSGRSVVAFADCIISISWCIVHRVLHLPCFGDQFFVDLDDVMKAESAEGTLASLLSAKVYEDSSAYCPLGPGKSCRCPATPSSAIRREGKCQTDSCGLVHVSVQSAAFFRYGEELEQEDAG